MTTDWPIDLKGVTESVVTTRRPDGGWAVAALGLHPGDPVTARTWGQTRTRRNFDREGGGVVQFTRDPVCFVDAALTATTVDEPVLEASDAWVDVRVERVATGTSKGTAWADWQLDPVETIVEREVVATIERGFNAVIEATVCASRLGVPAYDDQELHDRLAHHRSVAERCGGPREQDAIRRLNELIDG